MVYNVLEMAFSLSTILWRIWKFTQIVFCTIVCFLLLLNGISWYGCNTVYSLFERYLGCFGYCKTKQIKTKAAIYICVQVFR